MKTALLFVVLLFPQICSSSCFTPCRKKEVALTEELKAGKRGWDFSYSLLYWDANEKGLGFTNAPSNVLVTDNFTKTAKVNPSFDWEFGLRLGVGYTRSKWTYAAYWTYLKSKAQGDKTVDSDAPAWEGIFPVWSPSALQSDYVSSANAKWRLNTNIGDLIAQYHYLYKWLEILPIMGARVVGLDQKLTAQYSGGTFATGIDVNTLKSQYYGAGPRLGVDLIAALGKGFCLFGRGAVAPIFGQFQLHQEEKYLEAIQFDNSTNQYHFVLSTDYEVGLGWKGSVVEVSAAWEGQEFFYDNKFNRNLYLQGVTGTVGFAF
jgi:hypothetical protein